MSPLKIINPNLFVDLARKINEAKTDYERQFFDAVEYILHSKTDADMHMSDLDLIKDQIAFRLVQMHVYFAEDKELMDIVIKMAYTETCHKV